MSKYLCKTDNHRSGQDKSGRYFDSRAGGAGNGQGDKELIHENSRSDDAKRGK